MRSTEALPRVRFVDDAEDGDLRWVGMLICLTSAIGMIAGALFLFIGG